MCAHPTTAQLSINDCFIAISSLRAVNGALHIPSLPCTVNNALMCCTLNYLHVNRKAWNAFVEVVANDINKHTITNISPSCVNRIRPVAPPELWTSSRHLNRKQVVKEFWQKAASHIVLLLKTERSPLLRTPQQRLQMFFSGQYHSPELPLSVHDGVAVTTNH